MILAMNLRVIVLASFTRSLARRLQSTEEGAQDVRLVSDSRKPLEEPIASGLARMLLALGPILEQRHQGRNPSLTSTTPQRFGIFMEEGKEEEKINAAPEYEQFLSSFNEKDLEGKNKLVTDNLGFLKESFYTWLSNKAEDAEKAGDEEKEKELIDLSNEIYGAQLQILNLKVMDLMKALANEKGEFFLPLIPEQVDKLRATIRSENLGDFFFAIIQDSVRNADEEKMVDVSSLMRAVYQIFASERLMSLTSEKLQEQSDDDRLLLTDIMLTPAEQWMAKVQTMTSGDAAKCTPQDLQKKVEKTYMDAVMDLPTGSQTQIVLAEYLQELLNSIGKVNA